jgi:hypothetical protein
LCFREGSGGALKRPAFTRSANGYAVLPGVVRRASYCRAVSRARYCSFVRRASYCRVVRIANTSKLPAEQLSAMILRQIRHGPRPGCHGAARALQGGVLTAGSSARNRVGPEAPRSEALMLARGARRCSFLSRSLARSLSRSLALALSRSLSLTH